MGALGLASLGCKPQPTSTTSTKTPVVSAPGKPASEPYAVADKVANSNSKSPPRGANLLCGSLPAKAERLVSLAPSVTEILFALGLGPRLVGVTRYCDFPKAAQNITKIGGFLDPSAEAIAALRPDLVIAVPNGQNRGAIDQLCALKIPVLITYNRGVAEVEAGIRALGQDLAVADKATALLGKMRAELDWVRQQVAGKKPATVVFLYGHQPLVAAGAGTYAQSLIELAGGENIAARGASHYPRLSYESLLNLAPEHIIDAYPGGMAGGLDEGGLDLEALASVPAVRLGQVHRLHNASALRPGPRASEDAALIARLLHPEIGAHKNSAPQPRNQGSAEGPSEAKTASRNGAQP